MPTCTAYECHNSTSKGEKNIPPEVSFHRFPLADQDLLKHWLHNLGRRKNFVPNKTTRLCSAHFLSSCFLKPSREGQKKRYLNDGAVPTEFSHRKTAAESQLSIERTARQERRTQASLISGIKQTVTVPASSIKPMQSAILHQVNCLNKVQINPPETSGCNLYSTIKTEPFVDPTLENVSSREVTLSRQFCKRGESPAWRAPTSGCNLYSTIKTEPFVDPTLENVSSREVTLSRQFCKPGDQVKNGPPETSGCNLYSIIKSEPFVDPTLENVSSREVTLSRQFCKPGHQVNNGPPETSGCNLYSTIKTEPIVDPTLENVSSREVTLSRQFCKPGDQVQIEPPETSGCNLYSTIKIEQFVDPTLENVASGDVTPSVQFCKPGDITLPKNLPMSPCQSTDEALHVSQSGTATATKDISIQTDFDPSPEALHVSRSNTVKATKDISVQTVFDPSSLIVIDPSRVMVLDPSQVSDLHPSLIPGFNPADIPGFDPSQIPGYDPSQKYRGVYVNWKERVCGEPVEAMDGDLTETSDPQLRNQLEQTPLQKLICSLENMKPNIEEVIRCTETIQAARDEVVEALDSLKVPGTRSNVRQEFVSAMETMVEAASNNVLNMIKQLANTTRQQQTQFIHLAGFVQKIKKEQGKMEEELLKFRRVTLKVRCASKRKRTLAPEYRKTKFRKNNIDSYTDISKITENVQTRQMNTNDCSKIEGEQKSQSELCLSLPGPLETSVRHEFQNNRQSKDDRVTIKQIDNWSNYLEINKPEPSFPTNSQEFLPSNETDFEKDCG